VELRKPKVLQNWLQFCGDDGITASADALIPCSRVNSTNILAVDFVILYLVFLGGVVNFLTTTLKKLLKPLIGHEPKKRWFWRKSSRILEYVFERNKKMEKILHFFKKNLKSLINRQLLIIKDAYWRFSRVVIISIINMVSIWFRKIYLNWLNFWSLGKWFEIVVYI
jgi:hypothetical protein